MDRLVTLWYRSKVATIQVVLSFVLLLAFSYVPMIVGGAEYMHLALVGSLSLFIPYFYRQALIGNQLVHLSFRIFPMLFAVGFFLFKSNIVNGGAGLQSAVLAACGMYVSAFFFVSSD